MLISAMISPARGLLFQRRVAMDGSFDGQVLAKLPLAESVLMVMRYVFDTTDLSVLYENNRGRCYTKDLQFPVFVELFWECLTGPWDNVRSGLVKADAEGRLPVSLPAFYEKLAGTPVAVTRSLFRECNAKVRELLTAECSDVPACLRNLRVLMVDGKVIKHVQRRRPQLRMDRDNAARLLGGRALVVRDRWTGVAFDLEIDPDGEVNEIKYVSDLLLSIAAEQDHYLIVADRAFGVFAVCSGILKNHGEFLLRKHGMTKFVADPDAVEKRSTDRFGRPVIERFGWITRGKETVRRPAERIAVRQITVERDKETLVLITSLIDANAYPVDALLDTYLDRWDIEHMFQTVTEVFGLKPLASSSPQGTLMQFIMCLLISNMVQLIKLHIAASQKIPEQHISSETLFRDVAEELITTARLIRPEHIGALIPPRDATNVRLRLHQLLHDQWQTRWTKCNWKPRNPAAQIRSKPPKKKQTKSHDSVHRILLRNSE
jgi:Transposase DDE domain